MKNNSFIGTWYLEDISVCDKLIELHKSSDRKGPPFYWENGTTVKADPTIKDSTDLSISNHFEFLEIVEYLDQLQIVTNKYSELYVHANSYNPWRIKEPMNIQHYAPGQGYHRWHSERTSNQPVVATRHLVFMTYLNDVTDGGETEWHYQELKLKPKKGLTAIWPADWTHTHRGITSPTQDKYIITGWFNYVENNI